MSKCCRLNRHSPDSQVRRRDCPPVRAALATSFERGLPQTSSRQGQPRHVKMIRAGGVAAGDPRIAVRGRLGLFVGRHALQGTADLLAIAAGFVRFSGSGKFGVGECWVRRVFPIWKYANKKRRTRRELFLAEMDAVVPWPELLAVVEPHYPRAGGRGRPPVGLAAMLRVYFLQQWFALSDRQMEDGLYDIESLRRFAGFSNVTAALPDETTILNFRHLLEQHDLTTRLLEVVNGLLKAKGLLVSQGTMVDATIIHAPSSTKNAKGERDPEMHQTKKGNQW